MTSQGRREQKFQLGDDGVSRFWATAEDDGIAMWRAPVEADDSHGERVGLFSRDKLRTLLVWADQDSAVTSSMTGPLARQVISAAQELGMTPEMFVMYATRSMIEIGGAGQGGRHIH
ncbi:MAG: hypothetical protein ACOC5K_04485 [Chloroflexota bacterium]